MAILAFFGSDEPPRITPLAAHLGGSDATPQKPACITISVACNRLGQPSLTHPIFRDKSHNYAANRLSQRRPGSDVSMPRRRFPKRRQVPGRTPCTAGAQSLPAQAGGTQRTGQWSQFWPMTPSRQAHCPVTGSQVPPTANSVLQPQLSHPMDGKL